MDNLKRTTPKQQVAQEGKQRELKHQTVNQAKRETGHLEKKSRYTLKLSVEVPCWLLFTYNNDSPEGN